MRRALSFLLAAALLLQGGVSQAATTIIRSGSAGAGIPVVPSVSGASGLETAGLEAAPLELPLSGAASLQAPSAVSAAAAAAAESAAWKARQAVPAVSGLFYDEADRARLGIPPDAVDETGVFLAHLEQVRAKKAGPLPEVAKQGAIILAPGFNWDLLGDAYFKPNMDRLGELGLKAVLVATDPLAKGENNAAAIVSALQRADAPFVDIITHSGGEADVRAALRRIPPALRAKIRSVFHVQATLRGSPMMDVFLRDAARMSLYHLIMAAGRLLNPRRMFSTAISGWREGVREISSLRRPPQRGEADEFYGIKTFSLATRLRRNDRLGKLRAFLFKKLHEADNDGVLPTAGAVGEGARFAVLDQVGHLATISDPNWKTKLSGMGAPYAGFAADVTEALIRWAYSEALEPRSSALAYGAAPAAPARPRAPPVNWFWSAARLGATAAVLAPILYHAAPAPMLFYTAPAAFGLAGLAWLASRLPAWRPRFSWAGIRSWWSRPMVRFWFGATGGLVASMAVVMSHGVSPLPTLVYIGVGAFTVWAFRRLALRTVRLASALSRWLVGEAARDAQREAAKNRWTWALAGLIRLWRRAASAALGVGPVLAAPARWAWGRLLSWSSRRPAELGMAVGFAAALAAPFLAEAFPVVDSLYAGVMAVAGLWFIGTASELVRWSRLLWYRGLRWWRGRGGLFGSRPWRSALYAAGLLLGLGLGAMPSLFVRPVVEHGFYAGTLASRRVQKSELAMKNLPADWQAGLRMMAEGGEVNQIRGGAFEEETIRQLSRILRGRALLEQFRDLGGVIRLPKFYLIDQERSAAFENPIVHGVFLSPSHVTGRGWTIEEFLADEGKQREMAKDIWQLALHELTHTKQSFRVSFIGVVPQFFPGQFDHFPWQMASVFHLELEYEAHVEEAMAGIEMLEEDIQAPVDEWKIASFAADLPAFLKGIDTAGTYEAFKHVDSSFYRKYMAGVQERWPADSVRAYRLLALRYRDKDLARAWFYLDMARFRAQTHGLPEPAVNLPPRPAPFVPAPPALPEPER